MPKVARSPRPVAKSIAESHKKFILTMKGLLKLSKKEVKNFKVDLYDTLIPKLATMVERGNITLGQIEFLHDTTAIFEDDDEFLDFMKRITHHDGAYIDDVDVVVAKWIEMKKYERVFEAMPFIYDDEARKINNQREIEEVKRKAEENANAGSDSDSSSYDGSDEDASGSRFSDDGKAKFFSTSAS